MHLKGGNSPHVIDRTLDRCLQGTALGMAIDQDHHLTSCHDCTHTDSQRGLGYFIDVALEETTVGNDGIRRQRLLTGTTAQATTRLVESDVTIGTDTAEEQVDATKLLNLTLIGLALGSQVRGIAIEDMDILLGTVDVVEQVGEHERVVALGMLDRQTDILVHIKGDHVLERDLTLLTGLDQTTVHTDG